MEPWVGSLGTLYLLHLKDIKLHNENKNYYIVKSKLHAEMRIFLYKSSSHGEENFIGSPFTCWSYPMEWSFIESWKP